jgi:hypothetical protein
MIPAIKRRSAAILARKPDKQAVIKGYTICHNKYVEAVTDGLNGISEFYISREAYRRIAEAHGYADEL